MKTLLLFLLLASAAQADEWLVNGRTYKGTLHKFNADRTQVWATSDWDNYRGSWIKVADLDSATRVRLEVATPQEQTVVKAASQRAAVEVEQRRWKEQAAENRANARSLAQIQEQKLALQRQALELARRQATHQSQSVTNHTYIVPNHRGYSGYVQGSRSYTPGISVPRVPQVPHVPAVPHIPQVPAVPPCALRTAHRPVV